MPPCKHTVTRGRTHGGGSVGVSEDHAVSGKLVEIRRVHSDVDRADTGRVQA